MSSVGSPSPEQPVFQAAEITAKHTIIRDVTINGKEYTVRLFFSSDPNESSIKTELDKVVDKMKSYINEFPIGEDKGGKTTTALKLRLQGEKETLERTFTEVNKSGEQTEKFIGTGQEVLARIKEMIRSLNLSSIQTSSSSSLSSSTPVTTAAASASAPSPPSSATPPSSSAHSHSMAVTATVVDRAVIAPRSSPIPETQEDEDMLIDDAQRAAAWSAGREVKVPLTEQPSSSVSSASKPATATVELKVSSQPVSTDLKRTGPLTSSSSSAPVNPFSPASAGQAVSSLNPSLTADTPKAGEHIAFFSDDKGKPVATEVATQANTVGILRDSLQAQLEIISKREQGLLASTRNPDGTTNNDPSLLAQIRSLAEKKGHLKKEIAHLDLVQSDTTWTSTQGPRLAFKEMGVERAKTEMAPTLINLHLHQVIKANGKQVSAITRSGAISDFSHGEISLQELLDLKDLKRFDSAKSMDQFANAIGLPRDEAEIRIRSLFKQYGVDTETAIKNLESRVEQAYPEFYPKTVIENVDIALDKCIASRQNKLSLMALQDLYVHFDNRRPSGETTLWGRTALLDPQKAAKNEFGCVLNEKTMALDMQAIFEQMQGKTVHFDMDGDGCYQADNGDIHMPKRFNPSEDLNAPKTTRLHTVFFNISVQGNTGNVGLQADINSNAIKQLKAYIDALPEVTARQKTAKNDFQKRLGDLKVKLENVSEDKTFEVAQELTQLEVDLGAYTGLNCYGGKDRTGYAAAFHTHQQLVSGNRPPQPDSSDKRITRTKRERLADEALSRRWGWALLGGDGVAAQIANKNGDHRVLKLKGTRLALFGMGTAKGKALRFWHALQGLGLFLTTAYRLKTRTIATSSDETQMYFPRKHKVIHVVVPREAPRTAASPASAAIGSIFAGIGFIARIR